ncbi:MAG TPA: J domain-containing protein [Leptospiraceae bacterium]|nr:J domain-containing protein [Leptospiraceae bacterium]HMW03501.1 J domain-containing protein [Leptospiraceae bacterium]HMX33464.1 J domain-containing protein [Leptospiraceae bacterium]HMY29579.1 J domain-containing protein [Leptospiraceae bacterium]HMZ62931.1 J domain-containing protein [Leptospiraceae bacterium]
MNSLDLSDHVLEEVLSEIQIQSLDCTWNITNEKLIDVMGIRKEDFYRYLYNLRRNHTQSISLRSFSEKEADLLCILLEQILKRNDIEEQFIRSGIYFPETALEELGQILVELIQSSLKKHKLDKELFHLLVSSTKLFDDAFDSYFADKFDMEVLFERSISIFINSKNIDNSFGAEIFLKKHLQSLLKYNKISLAKITKEYRQRFYYELFGKFKREGKMDSETKRLLEFFELEDGATLKDLKKRFKELLLIYHPDVNKEGHAKTQEIIENYNKLFELIR